MNILILSPHADDAAFSCADHIIRWRKQSHEITVCTVFSKSVSGKISKDVQGFLNRSGYPDVRAFQQARIKEDRNALSYLDAHYLSPGLTDGAFRSKFNRLFYPTFDALFSGRLTPMDRETCGQLTRFLKRIQKQFDLILAPVGIGNHADHLITNQCAIDGIPSNKLDFYMDAPYYFETQNWTFRYCRAVVISGKSIAWTSRNKIAVLNYYASQTPLIIRNHRHVFFNEQTMFYPEIILRGPLHGIRRHV